MDIPFEDWPEYCRRNRVRLIGVRRLPNGGLQAIVESTDPSAACSASPAGAPPAGDAEQPPSGKERPRSALARSLAGMLRAAIALPGSQQHVDLPGGLRIDVLVQPDSSAPPAGFAAHASGGAGGGFLVKLLLSRANVYPSDTEWATVLAHWPAGDGAAGDSAYDPPLDLVPRRFEHNTWRCLTASWPLPNQQSEFSNQQSGELPHVPETLRPQPAR